MRLMQGRPARRWRSQRVCFLPGESPCGCRARWFWLLSLREHQSRLSAHAHRFLFRERSRPSRPPVFFLSGTCEEKTAGQRFSAPGWKRAHAGSDPACLVFTTQRDFSWDLGALLTLPASVLLLHLPSLRLMALKKRDMRGCLNWMSQWLHISAHPLPSAGRRKPVTRPSHAGPLQRSLDAPTLQLDRRLRRSTLWRFFRSIRPSSSLP